MRQKNRFFLGVFFTLFGSLLLPVCAVSQPSHTEAKKIPVNNFHQIVVLGNWDVNVSAGDESHVSVVMPKNKTGMPQFHVVQKGDVLMVSGEEVDKNHPLSIDVTTPQLEGLELRGAKKAHISGFKVKNLTVRTDGETTITGDNNQIQYLKLRAAGNSNIDFSSSKITSANVQAYGKNKTTLNMNGGNLTGFAKGAVSIMYSGTVKQQRISKTGAATVRHRAAEPISHKKPAVKSKTISVNDLSNEEFFQQIKYAGSMSNEEFLRLIKSASEANNKNAS